MLWDLQGPVGGRDAELLVVHAQIAARSRHRAQADPCAAWLDANVAGGFGVEARDAADDSGVSRQGAIDAAVVCRLPDGRA